MSKPIIHLWSIAGSDSEIAQQLGLDSIAQVVSLIQQAVGQSYRVTANTKLMKAVINEQRGGRSDDAARARDIEDALADDRVRGILSLRGGSWLARILPQVNFDVLKRRKTPVDIFGFSELTPLINIVGQYSKVRAHYDLGPGFLLWALRSHAATNYERLIKGLGSAEKASPPLQRSFALGWAKAMFKPEYLAFIGDMIEIMEGRGSQRDLCGTLLRGSIKSQERIVVVGGCLSTLVTLLGSPHQRCLSTKNKWLAIEDIRESMHRIDRYLAQLKLAGLFDSCAGLLLGDFHLDGEDQTSAILKLLKCHLPKPLPVIAHCNFGHIYGMASLPINQPLAIERVGGSKNKRVKLVPIRAT